MAQNITIMGASYSSVPAVTLPKTGGGTASFTDVTGTTATADKILEGYGAYGADGAWMNGTATGGSSVSVEALSVTQNGTYTAPTGKAYSPVTVNVSGGGGSSASKKQINFIDYDGTIVESYTKTEWQSVTALPSNPSHTGLTAQGWNWTKAQIDAQLTAMPDGDVWVGQMYITTSGDTEIDLRFADSARLSPTLTICVNGTITVDWGDGSTADTVTGTSLTARRAVPHTYASAGDYTMTIHVVSGSFTFYGSNTYLLLRKNTNANQSRVYAKCVRAIRLGSGITSIGQYAFYNCSFLESITIPKTITSVDDYLFYSCIGLASITIPSSVTSIGTYTFYNDYALTSVSIPSEVQDIGTYVFYTCYLLESVTIPKGITSLANYMVYSCSNLSNIAIPNEVTTIEPNAFQMCYVLASITIPSNVTSIGASAFASCYGVAEYHIKPTTPPTLANTNAFSGIQSDCVIYVPSASLEAYQTATNWSTYASYMVGE